MTRSYRSPRWLWLPVAAMFADTVASIRLASPLELPLCGGGGSGGGSSSSGGSSEGGGSEEGSGTRAVLVDKFSLRLFRLERGGLVVLKCDCWGVGRGEARGVRRHSCHRLQLYGAPRRPHPQPPACAPHPTPADRPRRRDGAWCGVWWAWRATGCRWREARWSVCQRWVGCQWVRVGMG